MRRWPFWGAAGALLILATGAQAATTTNFAKSLRWSSEFGTTGDDRVWGVAVTPIGDVYEIGQTTGHYAGSAPGTGSDAVIAKFKKTGESLWLDQFGSTTENDSLTGVAVAPNGDVYVTGTTQGEFPGFTNPGSTEDAFVARFDKNGNQKFVTQLGTSGEDIATGIAVTASGDAYITGQTDGDLAGPDTHIGSSDGFIARFDKNGHQKWIKQFGTTEEDDANAIKTSATGDSFVTGATYGDLAAPNLGSADAFLLKFDKNGNQKFAAQFGTGDVDSMYGVALGPSGSIFLTGKTYGTLPDNPVNPGGSDAVIGKWDKNGNPVWVYQFGTTASDFGNALVVSKTGRAFVAGDTQGAFPGFASGNDQDGFMAAFDPLGVMTTVRQFGSSSDDEATGIGLLPSGDLVVGGYAGGQLTGFTFKGFHDNFLLALPAS